jgi:hypothetical protein
MFDRGHEFSPHTIDQGRLRSYRVATQILGQPPNRQRGDSTGKVLPATTNGLKAAVAPWRRDGDPAAAAPSVQRGFELESGFRLRIFSEFGVAQAVAEKFVAGGRLLELPELSTSKNGDARSPNPIAASATASAQRRKQPFAEIKFNVERQWVDVERAHVAQCVNRPRDA